MKKVGEAFENFAFKAFDFSGRATLLEYWLMMPLVWGLILFLAWGDAVEFFDFLLQREVPPLNPLYWDSIVVFFVTLIPRISLTVRRLHDSGKSGKWVKLPMVAFVSGLVLFIGVFSAIATSNAANGNFSAQLSMFAVIAAFSMGSAEVAWEMAFAAAAALNAIGLDAVIGMLAEIFSTQEGNVSQGLSNATSAMSEQPAIMGAMMLQFILIVGTPFVAAFLHLFFMISPSKPDDDFGTAGLMSGASLRQKGEVSDNPFAGYKYLYARTPEQEAAHKAAAKQEIQSLYKQRVLGQQEAG